MENVTNQGHQDDHTALDQLDIWSCWNIEVDKLTKGHISMAKQHPQHVSVSNKPWSIWAEEVRSQNNSLKPCITLSMKRKLKITEQRKEESQESSQDSIKGAMSKIPRQCKVSHSKHMVRMCGMGKFMKIWKEWDTNHCLRSGQPEDAPHVWRCPDAAANLIWNTLICKLDEWMGSTRADPDI
jgi:hypothetical protein